MKKFISVLSLVLLCSFSLNAQKSISYTGVLGDKEINASFILVSGESSGTFFLVNAPKETYDIYTVTKLNNQVEVRILLNGNKFASGTLEQTNVNENLKSNQNKIKLEGNVTKYDGTAVSLVLIEE